MMEGKQELRSYTPFSIVLILFFKCDYNVKCTGNSDRLPIFSDFPFELTSIVCMFIFMFTSK